MSNEEQQRYLDNITVKAETLIEALPYIRDFNSKKVVVKYGGSAMLDHNPEESVIKDVALLKLVGMQPIIVHGGGKEISKWISKVGKETRFEEGFRVTDKDTMEIAEMVLNKVGCQSDRALWKRWRYASCSKENAKRKRYRFCRGY